MEILSKSWIWGSEIFKKHSLNLIDYIYKKRIENHD